MTKSRRDEIAAQLRRELFPSKPQAKPEPSAQEVWDNRQRELAQARYQAAIDAVWERTVAARREVEAEAARCCHRGPGDGDYWR